MATDHKNDTWITTLPLMFGGEIVIPEDECSALRAS
jgi:hypothetical protein